MTSSDRPFIPFDLERWQSLWENHVSYNLTESGVHPMTLKELAGTDTGLLDEVLNLEINYPQTNGTLELRGAIAHWYEGAGVDNVHVTTGAAQANFTTLLTILQGEEKDAEIAVLLPNYMQIWGIAKNLGVTVNTFSLKEEQDWALDLDELEQAVTEKTRLIAVCNPNNPTGHIFTPDEMDGVVEIARKNDAWLLSDEVYAGAELHREDVTPSFWGRYEKVLAIGSMSKAYGLPGLRVGWVVAPEAITQALWEQQDYITISASMLGNKLAAYALSPEVRPRILTRTRKYIRRGYKFFENWLQEQGDLFTVVKPQAAAIAFVRYHLDVNSTELCSRLRDEKDVFIVPGDHFGLDQHVRISFGLSKAYLNESLSRFREVLKSY
ncbi:MAG: aminotransferase class I/II-fold pyridoxal phosphate-dependent enzyme [Anaerolineaceae bacterium]|nr:aminotransferase class I/II-fold pyridoxal phosphate-dependent enzyme [Anaerolineaceae bacterium]